MGFYAPAQIVRDAREHGVEVHEIDVAASAWDCTLEADALRLGFRLISGFSQEWAERLVKARSTNFAELIVTGLPRAALVLLAEADALRSLKLDRRAALWQVRSLSDMAELPLFAHQPVAIHHVPLPVMTKGEHVIADYQTAGLSLKSHPMRFLRSLFTGEGGVELRSGYRTRGWYARGGGWRGVGASAARQRQCGILHYRGRDRHRQYRDLVQSARPVPSRSSWQQPSAGDRPSTAQPGGRHPRRRRSVGRS